MMKREGLVLGMSELEYHGGKDRELSSTGAKLLLDSPARYRYEMDRKERDRKPAWDLGTAVHTAVLGVGQQTVELPEKFLTASGARSTAAPAREWVEEQEAAGLIVMKADEMDQIKAMKEAVLADADALALLTLEGNPEASVFATCPDTGARLRGRFDYLPTSHDVAVDLKTVGRAGGAKESEFARQVFNFGYDVQAAQYLDTLRYATGRDCGFTFVVVETAAPYLVNVIEVTDEYMEIGRGKSFVARNRWSRGMKTGEWPGYEAGIKKVGPPGMAVYDYHDNYESEDLQI